MTVELGSKDNETPGPVELSSVDDKTKAHAKILKDLAKAVNLAERQTLEDAERHALAALVRALHKDDHVRRLSLAAALNEQKAALEARSRDIYKTVYDLHLKSALRSPSTVLAEAAHPTHLILPSSGLAEAWRKVGAYLAEGMKNARVKIADD